MKCMERNKSKFYYALYEGKTPIVDEYGNKTGESELIYSAPKPYEANISAAKGETEVRQFGDDLAYDKVIVMDGDAPKINEFSILWVDDLPVNGKTVPHDYVVKKIAGSLNSVSIAISKVKVSE